MYYLSAKNKDNVLFIGKKYFIYRLKIKMIVHYLSARNKEKILVNWLEIKIMHCLSARNKEVKIIVIYIIYWLEIKTVTHNTVLP